MRRLAGGKRQGLYHGVGLATIWRDEAFGIIADKLARSEAASIDDMKARLKRSLRDEGKLCEDA